VRSQDDYQEGVRARLCELRERLGQSEIARRVGVPLSNVHRYMREGKIPVEFCSALVDGFAVNPAWLLTGEGGALLSQVSEPTAELGKGLLALVESMNAVSRMRLGALAGSGRQKVLRELNDALGAFERLRDKLHLQSKPVFGSILDELAASLRDFQIDRAVTLRQAAIEVSRLCDDEALRLRMDSLLSDLEYFRGRVDASLDHARRVFAHSMQHGSLPDNDACNQALTLVMTLKDAGRYREAYRTALAALALAQDHGGDWHAYRGIDLFAGHLELELGKGREGLARVQRAHPRYDKESPESAGLAAVISMRAMLLSGLMTPSQAIGSPTRTAGTARLLLRWAGWTEDRGELQAVCDDQIGDIPQRLPVTEFEAQRALLMLRLLQGKRRVKFAEYQRMSEKHPPHAASTPVRDIVLTSHAAQFARLCGDWAACARLSGEFEAACKALPPELYVNLDLLSLHHRNVLALAEKRERFAGKKRVEAAKQFFRSHAESGYGCFAGCFRDQAAL
jgi:tetratricopeptide (TPR) repeat protein